MPARGDGRIHIAVFRTDFTAAAVDLVICQQTPAVHAQAGTHLRFNTLKISRIDAQLRFAFKHRLLLDELLDLVEQGGTVTNRCLTQNLFGRRQRHLHQALGDNAIERIQRLLEIGHQHLPVFSEHGLLLLAFQ